jgi:hypothetical protein
MSMVTAIMAQPTVTLSSLFDVLELENLSTEYLEELLWLTSEVNSSWIPFLMA